MKQDIKKEIEMPEGVSAQATDHTIAIKGPKGEVKRSFHHPRVKIAIDGQKITLTATAATRREKMILGSFASHVKNIVAGVQELHLYKLAICSGHFPMNITVSGNELVIKNFLGESVPRKVAIPEGAEVKVEGKEILITSADKEVAGQTAARIEGICRENKKDIRIFMDGLWIVEKSGKK